MPRRKQAPPGAHPGQDDRAPAPSPPGMSAKSSGRRHILRILMVASEVQPYSKTGGLADVASALPRALGQLGHQVSLVTPRYRGIEAGVLLSRRQVRLGSYLFDTGFFEEPVGPNARLIFVDVPALYHRDGIYNERNVDYADNALRYAFLSVAALDWAAHEPQPFSVVHAHDWQAGLTPVYLRRSASNRQPATEIRETGDGGPTADAERSAPGNWQPAAEMQPGGGRRETADVESSVDGRRATANAAPGTALGTGGTGQEALATERHPAPDTRHPTVDTGHPGLSTLPCIFTIHNLAYQGIFDKRWVPHLDLGWDRFSVGGFEYWDRLSFLKAGVNFSDLVTTVSPTYAIEIQQPEYGFGFDGVMRTRGEALVGILNGIDVADWNPSTDPYLPTPYSADDIDGKADAKRALLEAFGLSTDAAMMARPIVGMVSRMVDQKGFDLLEVAAGRLTELDATFLIVGSGDPRYQELGRRLNRWRPDRFGVFIGFDEARAHLVEAGSDLFLMPSRYEPCGLNQMYSLRYGTVPIVRATGGLADTVRPFDPRTGHGTGFVFHDYQPDALYDALVRALAVFRTPRAWRRLQKNGMRKDFSWQRSAVEYVKVYKRVMAARALEQPKTGPARSL